MRKLEKWARQHGHILDRGGSPSRNADGTVSYYCYMVRGPRRAPRGLISVQSDPTKIKLPAHYKYISVGMGIVGNSASKSLTAKGWKIG